MIRHLQTETDDGVGNCFATCLACLLDLPVDVVPNFKALQERDTHGTYDMIMEADKWLRREYSRRIITVEIYDQEDGPNKGSPLTRQCLMNRLAATDDLVILSGESPRRRKDGGRKWHCVIAKPQCWGFELIHDPHPDGTGIVGQPYGVKWIVPVN